MKKLAALVGAGAVLLSMTAGVFAKGQVGGGEGILVVNKGSAMQITNSFAVANTGLNDIEAGKNSGSIKQDASIRTGDAMALSSSQSIANQFVTKIKVIKNSFVKNGSLGQLVTLGGNSGGEAGVKVINESGRVFQMTNSAALSSSGLNDIVAGKNKGTIKQVADIVTGDATSMSESSAWANIFDTKVVSISNDTSINMGRPNPCNI